MNFTMLTAEQRSEAWYAARAGRLTGSCAEAATAERKRGVGELAARRELRLRLVAERLTGMSHDRGGFVSEDMQRGIDKEREAFAAYEALTGHYVKRSGFLQHNEWMAGCSLDGHVGNFDGLIELKCPASTTHLEYLQATAIPPEYLPQVTHNLWVSGAEWADFVSFDDRFQPELALFRLRVERKDVDIAAYETAALKFLAEVDFEVKELRARLERAVA